MSVERAREERIRPLAPPISIVLLDEIAGRLQELGERILTLAKTQEQLLETTQQMQKTIQQTIPEGFLVPREVSIVDSEIVNLTGEEWYSFSAVNDGPDPVYIGVNTYPEMEVPINKKESYDCPMNKRGSIRTIYLVCGKGKSATVRLYGVK